MKKTFLVIDGNALLHRGWHAIPPLMTKDGRVVNAVYGFAMVVEKIRDQFNPDYITVAWDLPEATFRHKEFKEYKAQREKKSDELYKQIEWIQDLLELHGIPSISVPGFEADDVIGTLAKTYAPKLDLNVLILTGDLDALQLVDKNIKVVIFVKGLSETKIYDEEAVFERYRLKPNQLIDLKALMGDSSDNIPGIEGIGKKGATDLIQAYGSMDGVLAALKDNTFPSRYMKRLLGKEKEVAQMQMLVTIVLDVKLVGFTIEAAKVVDPDEAGLVEMYRDLEFKRFVDKYQKIKIDKKNIIKEKKIEDKIETISKLPGLNTDKLVVCFERGPQDLFGGMIKTIALFDGRKQILISTPSEKQIKEIIVLLSGVTLIIGHDLKELFHILQWSCSQKITGRVFDTKIAAYLLSAGSRKFDFNECIHDYLGGIEIPDTILEVTALTYQLYEVLVKELEAEELLELAFDIEFPLIFVLYSMEAFGIELNKAYLENLSKIFGEKLEILTKDIYKEADREFNINSPAQLSEILFEELGLPTKGIKKTKTNYSTAASELEKLWDSHNIISMIAEYREFAKLKSTYIDALPKLIAGDGRIHTSFNQAITATGRLSSSDPNLQNIPTRSEIGKEIRKAFVAPESKVLLSIDYSQFELRVAAVLSQDKILLQAFRDGADIHRRTAAEVLDKAETDVTKKERSAAKAINFGILYGMGARHLARSTGFSKIEAKEFIQKYFDIHPGIRDYIDAAKVKVHHDGYVETLFGRRRYLPEINSGMHMLIASAERMAVNMPIQGTQADLVKVAMLQVDDWIQKSNLDIKMLLQVHDELVFEILRKDLNKVVPKLKNIMENIWDADIPLLVDCEFGKNWGDLKDF